VTASQQATFSATSGGSLLATITNGPGGWGPGKSSSAFPYNPTDIAQVVTGTLATGLLGFPPALVLSPVLHPDGMAAPGVATVDGVAPAVGDQVASAAHGAPKHPALLATVTIPGPPGLAAGDLSPPGPVSGLAAALPPLLLRVPPSPLLSRLAAVRKFSLAPLSVFRLSARLLPPLRLQRMLLPLLSSPTNSA
jgi:hypothetical protein